MMVVDFSYIEVANPRWADAEHTRINCDVTWGEDHPYLAGETHPFTAIQTDMFAAHSAKIWGQIVAGNYGLIAEYEPPEPQA